ncbi:MAG TPA: DNRLRE domain-containing protein [Gemmataceae bacterium]|jgi:hypothetical protein
MLPHWLRAVRRRFLPAPRPALPARRARLSALPLEDRVTPSVSVFQQGVNGYTGTLDTGLTQATPTTNRATNGNVTVDFTDPAPATNTAEGLLRFNNLFSDAAGPIPLGAKIIRATLTLSQTAGNAQGDGGEFHRMLINWSDTATWNGTGAGTGGWNSTPGLQDDGVEMATAFDSSAGIDTRDQDVQLGFQDIDVTRDLQAWSGGTSNFGWGIIPWDSGTDGWIWDSANNATVGQRPKLTVEWLPATTSVAGFQQGVGGYTGTHDTWLQENAPDADNSATSMIFVDAADPAGGNENQVLLRFDSIFGNGPGQVPLGSTILGATLRFETSGGNAQGDGGHMNRMLTPWTDTASWNSVNDGIQTNDVEAASVYDSSVGNPAGDPNYTNWSPLVDVSADLQAWSNGLANNGWAMIPWVGGSDGWGFRTSEFGTASERPQLTVYYGPPAAAPPANNTLDVVNGVAIYTGGTTAPNNAVTLDAAGGNYTITDTGGPITLTAAAVTAGWTGNGTNVATGPDATTTGLTFDLNQGNDSFALRAVNDPLTVTGGGQSGDTATLPVSLTYTGAGAVSVTGFNTITQTSGTVQTIGTLTLGANTIGSSGTPIRTTAGTVTLTGGTGGVFLTESDGANVTFKATGAGSVQITNLLGALIVAGTSFGGTGPTVLSSADAVAVNAPVIAGGRLTIAANTDGAGTDGFSQGAQGSIVVGDGSATAFALTVNTAAGGTGNAAFGSGATTVAGATITVDANGGAVTGTAGTLLRSGGAATGSAVLHGAAIGTAALPIRTSTGHIRAAGGDGGVFINELSDSPGTAQATATGPGNIVLAATAATNNGMIIDGPVWTQSGNITIQADDNLDIQAPIGGSRNGQNFSGTILMEASKDLVNEQFFKQWEDPNLGFSGTVATTNNTATAVVINVSATTTTAGTGGGAILGHITVGNGGTITVNAQAGTRTDRTGRILMNSDDQGNPNGLLDAGPTGTVILQAKNNSIGQAPFAVGSAPIPILVTAGTVVATANSIDPNTSASPLQLPGDIYVTSNTAAAFAATTTSAPGYTTDLGFPTGTDADVVLTTLSGPLTIAPGAIGTTTVNTRTDSGSIVLTGANGIVLNGAVGGAGESGVVVLSAGGGAVTQPGGSVVTTGGLLVTSAGSTALGQAANDLATVAASVTGAFSIADANAVATGTVTPPAALVSGIPGATGITATNTTVTGGRLNVMSGANVTGPATAAAGGTLGGTGTVTGTLTAQANGTVSPGTSPGILNVGATTFAAGSTFAVELNGTTVGTQYDQLNVTGTVNLGGATLSVTPGFAGAVGNTFVIVNNDGTDAVTGTFAGLPEGALFQAGGQFFTISYAGGTNNNDVVLTRAAAPAPLTVVSAVVNDGSSNQRSTVRSITVTFSGPATFVGGNANAAAAFQLARTGPTGTTGNVGLTATVSTDGQGRTVVKLTFSGPFTESNTAAGADRSLIDGKYTLTVFGTGTNAVTGPGGLALDGDANGTAGGDFVLATHRLFGDIDGDGDVDLLDLNPLVPALFATQGQPNYNPGFDFEGDGDVDLLDLNQFVQRLFLSGYTP